MTIVIGALLYYEQLEAVNVLQLVSCTTNQRATVSHVNNNHTFVHD